MHFILELIILFGMSGFCDENMQDSVAVNLGDGPDTYTDYTLLRRGKRYDYFTCLSSFSSERT